VKGDVYDRVIECSLIVNRGTDEGICGKHLKRGLLPRTDIQLRHRPLIVGGGNDNRKGKGGATSD